MTVIVTPNEIIQHGQLELTYGAVDTVRCQINGGMSISLEKAVKIAEGWKDVCRSCRTNLDTVPLTFGVGIYKVCPQCGDHEAKVRYKEPSSDEIRVRAEIVEGLRKAASVLNAARSL